MTLQRKSTMTRRGDRLLAFPRVLDSMRDGTALFGGAMSILSLEDDYLDASDVRPVPDHQEVFTQKDSPHRALVIELLEMLSGSHPNDAREHFHEIAHRNNASTQHIKIAQQGIQICKRSQLPVVQLTGMQTLADGTQLHVTLCLVRIASHCTDLLVTVCRPVQQGVAASDNKFATEVCDSLAVHDWGLFDVTEAS